VAAQMPLVAGCLPDDTRPPPGSVLVTLAATEELLEPLPTADGWTIALERLVIGLGTVELHGEDCTPYAQAHYSRLFDFTEPVAPDQRLGLVYGLGTCSLEFRVRAPHTDALLGPGVGRADIEAMRIEVLEDGNAEPQRTSVWAVGEATRADGTSKRFDWMFRRRYNIKECAPGPEGQPGSSLEIHGGETFEHTVVIDGAQLFRPGAASDSPLVFDPFAAADANDDGAITLAELSEVTIPIDPEVIPEGGTSQLLGRTVADLLYEVQLPRLAGLEGAGICNAEIDGRRW
jgi:hypothetical protein